MKLIKQPNRWSCLPTSFAMALDVSLKEIIDYLGHDGSEKIFPDRKEPHCRRAFHSQELIDYAWTSLDVPVVQFDTQAISMNLMCDTYTINYKGEIEGWLKRKYRKVLSGISKPNRPHAVACDEHGLVYDPNGTKYTLNSNFNIMSIFIIIL